MAVIVAVQARMSSTRLPGKALMDIAGKTMLERVLAACSGPWDTMVLTSTDPTDDMLAVWMDDQAVRYRRGSLTNVLSRYTEVAIGMQPDVLVRVCADAPFLEKRWVDRAIDEVLDKRQPVFIPGALHAGSSEHWFTCGCDCSEADLEHAGAYWFEAHGRHIHGLVPADYRTVNTKEDMEWARDEWIRRHPQTVSNR